MTELAPRRLILTLYGLYAREEHNWMSVGSMVRLMGDLGVDSAGVRSSISRLKRRGVLESMKSGRVAGYALSESALEVLREGDSRFFDAQARWKRSADGPRTAFEIYVPMLTVWRRLPYLDPGLPVDLLPVGWNGGRAADLFGDLDALLRAPAREHALAVIRA